MAESSKMFSQIVQSKRRRREETLAKVTPPLNEALAPRPDPAPPAEELVCGRYRKQDLRVFQCSQCFTVLGDSLSLCGEDPYLDCLICLRVTNGVLMEKQLMFGVVGALAGSAYYPLFCSSCRLLLGVCLYSTNKHLARLLSLFCLYKDKIFCYLFENKKTVRASELTFNVASLMSEIAETNYPAAAHTLREDRPKIRHRQIKHQLVEAFNDMQTLKSQLKELPAEDSLKVESDQKPDAGSKVWLQRLISVCTAAFDSFESQQCKNSTSEYSVHATTIKELQDTTVVLKDSFSLQ